jgi:hypothetical protein
MAQTIGKNAPRPAFRGIIVGCDQNQEWLLPWWWQHYAEHNHYPVVFMNFGMSEEASRWCRERGDWLDLSKVDTAKFAKKPKGPLNAVWDVINWEALWTQRLAWFKKPFACHQSPFEQTLWLDLDCQVRGGLSPLFHCLGLGIEIGICPEAESVQRLYQEQGFLLPGEVNYNSGVIAFRKNTLIDHWLEQLITNNDQFLGDQQALSRAIFLHRPTLIELPPSYNWSLAQGPNELAIIHHYHGCKLKLEIAKTL